MCFYYIFLTFIYRGKLPIVLFVGQHFSGSLFHLITLLLFTRETTKGTRARELGAPSPYLLGSLPNQLFLLSDVRSGSIAKAMLSVAPSFLTHTPTPSGCWLNSNNHRNILCPVNAGTLNATCPQVSTYISG